MKKMLYSTLFMVALMGVCQIEAKTTTSPEITDYSSKAMSKLEWDKKHTSQQAKDLSQAFDRLNTNYHSSSSTMPKSVHARIAKIHDRSKRIEPQLSVPKTKLERIAPNVSDDIKTSQRLNNIGKVADNLENNIPAYITPEASQDLYNLTQETLAAAEEAKNHIA